MMWIHARDHHGGEMSEKDWKSTITSTHKKALERQVTEAVTIAKGMKNVVLLNSKHEFGANLLNEVLVMRGGQILGKRNNKRRRNSDKAPKLTTVNGTSQLEPSNNDQKNGGDDPPDPPQPQEPPHHDQEEDKEATGGEETLEEVVGLITLE